MCIRDRFRAELRGLSEALNQPQGRSFLRSCSAVLGDAACRFNTQDPVYSALVPIDTVREARSFDLRAPDFVDRWFEQGKLTVMSGAAKGLSGVIKHDRRQGAMRDITLWHPLRAAIAPGDEVRIVAGCDKRAETCRVKFDNFVNYQGFPHIPGEDWLMAVPRAGSADSGESMN